MAGLIELSGLNLLQKNLTRDYLTAIVHNCGSDQHYRVISNPRHTAVVHNIANPPGDSEISQLSERLDMSAAFELLAYREGTIPTITGKGLIIAPMLDVTHINPKLLPHALKQEQTHEANDANTLDLRTWTHLPKIIKDQWRRFNSELRTHIMNCMTEFLRKQSDISTCNLDYSNTLFATTSTRQFPHIPVKISSHETRDLMDVLGASSVDRVNLNQLMPCAKASEELRFRINTQPTTISRRI